MKKIIGVISDTHGLIRSNALKSLAGSDIIIHAGDIGSQEVLDSLEKIAPVYAVLGNTDRSSWSRSIPSWDIVSFEGINIYVRHILDDMDLDPEAASVNIVITGHTHMPKIERRHHVLYFNPGSAGPLRWNLPITVGRITLKGSNPVPEIIRLL